MHWHRAIALLTVILIACFLPGLSSQGGPSQVQQDAPERKTFTLSGSLVEPDGTPAAGRLVEVFVSRACLWPPPPGGGGEQGPPPELLFHGIPQGDELLGKGMTDAKGRFSIEVNRAKVRLLEIRVGDKLKSSWTVKAISNEDRDTDIGKVQLIAKVSVKGAVRAGWRDGAMGEL
jgi:hypothetical protein